jgi:5,10-methylenetetrahydrofolate reductase
MRNITQIMYKTELTIGSYYDLSMKKIGNLSKNPFILFYVMMVDTSAKSVITQLFFSEAEYREFVINKILKDESNLYR